MKNIIIENGINRYDLLFGEHEHPRHGYDVCVFIWLRNGVAGPALTWDKGRNLYAGYILGKVDINCADLTCILSAIKKKFPDSIGEMMGFDDNYMYQGV